MSSELAVLSTNRPVVEERLKTKASKRRIPIPPQLVECLTEAKTIPTHPLSSEMKMAHHWLNHNSNAYGSTSKNVLWEQEPITDM